MTRPARLRLAEADPHERAWAFVARVRVVVCEALPVSN